MKTKFGEITPQVIEDAYLITGYKPNTGNYINHDDCQACALGVYTHLHDPKANIAAYPSWIKIMESLGISALQEHAFSDGFIGFFSSPHTTPEEYEAWSTGKACREHLISKGMIP